MTLLECKWGQYNDCGHSLLIRLPGKNAALHRATQAGAAVKAARAAHISCHINQFVDFGKT